jgi:hypothetical protein
MFPQKQKHIKFNIPEQLLFVPFTEVLHFPSHSRKKIGTNYSRNTEEYSSNQEYCEFDPENSINASKQ